MAGLEPSKSIWLRGPDTCFAEIAADGFGGSGWPNRFKSPECNQRYLQAWRRRIPGSFERHERHDGPQEPLCGPKVEVKD